MKISSFLSYHLQNKNGGMLQITFAHTSVFCHY